MDSNLAEKIAKESADRLWFVARGSVLKGPFNTAQLREKVAKREISFLDFCWRHGFNEWRPIGSIEDFDRRSRFKRLPHYPNVEVPASMTGGIYLKDTSPPEEEAQAQPKKPASEGHRSKYVPPLTGPKNGARFEVSFAKQRRHSISIYEWGLAAVLGVTMAYFAADYAMHEVAHSVSAHMAYLVAGTEQKFGTARAAVDSAPVHPEFWQPLYSAPSFVDTLPNATEQRLDLPAPFRLDSRLSGRLEISPNGNWNLAGYAIALNAVPELWSAADEGIDGVYTRPVQVAGQLSLHDALTVEVSFPGEPRIFYSTVVPAPKP